MGSAFRAVLLVMGGYSSWAAAPLPSRWPITSNVTRSRIPCGSGVRSRRGSNSTAPTSARTSAASPASSAVLRAEQGGGDAAHRTEVLAARRPVCGVHPSPWSGEPLVEDKLCYKIVCTNTAPAPPNPSLQVADEFGTRTLSKLKPYLVCGPAVQGPGIGTPTPSVTGTPATATQPPPGRPPGRPPRRHVDLDENADGDRNGDRHAAHGDHHTHSDRNTHGHAHGDHHTHSDRNTHGHTHGDHHTHSDRDTTVTPRRPSRRHRPIRPRRRQPRRRHPRQRTRQGRNSGHVFSERPIATVLIDSTGRARFGISANPSTR